MDDLYGNLENYDEVNALEELRIENKELKAKIDDYAATMNKLQNDFDKLASEFKTLESNYSSLLKTARAEIERKTQMITNINIEKDMLILNSLQNGNRNILRRNITNKPLPVKKDWKENEPNRSNCQINTKESKDNRNLGTNETPSERMEEIQTPSGNIITGFTANNTNKLTNIVSKVTSSVDSHSDRNSESKENMHHPFVEQIHEDVKPQSLGIKNRRKSMPAASMMYEKFSSDEDFDSPSREQPKNDCAIDKHGKNILDKTYKSNHRTKMSESSSMDDKTSGYHESSRETFKSKTNRIIENDKFKNREKYDTSFRHRRHYSPERSYQRSSREYLDDRYLGPNYGRGRDVRNPPPDRFQHIQRRSRDYHFNYNERNKLCTKERYMHRQDRNPVKHKIPNDYDEPYNKRQRTDSYNRNREEDTRWHNREHKDVEPIEETLEHLQVLQSQYTSCTSPDHLQDTPFLSPDHVATDGVISEPKEIMDTADTQLEDPRVSCDEYVVKNDEGKIMISTVIGRNVDLKLLDKAVWGIKEVAVPEALVQPPIEDQLIQEIYMDIDKPVLNVPMEPGEEIGEINFDSEYIPSKDVQNEAVKFTNKIPPEKKPGVNESHQSIKVFTSNYKIPKHKQCDKDAIHQSSHDKSVKSLGLIEDFHSTSHSKSSYNTKTKIDKEDPSMNMTEKHDNSISNGEGGVENKIHNWLHINEHQRSNQIAIRETVEGDLELSDETCDHTELQKQTFNYNFENRVLSLPIPSDITLHTHSDSQVSHIVEYDNDITTKMPIEIKNNNASNSSNGNLEVEKLLIKETCVDSTPDINKPIGKKQKLKETKCKDTNNKMNEPLNSTEKILTKDKRTKPKKEKPKQIKTKFRDLFGDSSSLITPEDLGLAAISTQVEIPPPTNYVPIFEDAVDATDIKQIAKVTARASENVMQDPIPSHKTDDKAMIETDKSAKTPKESKKKKSKKVEDPKVVPNEVVPTVTTMHDHLNIEAVTKESDVVKTVVISTGVQPQLTSVRSTEINTKPDEEVENLVSVIQKQNDSSINREMLIAALATSTPQKDVCQPTQFVSNSRIPESSCSNDSRAVSIDNVTPAANLSDTLDSQTEIDVPDVRIFVRRRKKVIKRPPVT